VLIFQSQILFCQGVYERLHVLFFALQLRFKHFDLSLLDSQIVLKNFDLKLIGTWGLDVL
jgi:hypothetical protein